MDVWQNCRPGNKFPVVCKRTRNKWHIIYVGHAWGHWQTAAKEGRELLALAKASNADLRQDAGSDASNAK